MKRQPQASGASPIASSLTGNPPDIDRTDVEIVVVDQRVVEAPELQRAAADATLAAWDATPWPDGMISRTCYVSSDGQRVLTYEQWRAGYAAGVVPPRAIAFRLYRSGVRDDAPVPGCIVIVEVQTDGPETARRWVDSVFDALAAETTLHSGGISGHFHISLDGTRVLNYAEWVDEASHVEALGQAGSIGRGPAWRKVQSMPGVENRGFRRYRVYGVREGSNVPLLDV